MGLFTKSITLLLIALSVPLLYRHFADQNTVKFMSQYYANYKSIDTFLRQSAGHIDRAKDYLPDKKHIQTVVDKVNQQYQAYKAEFAKSTPEEPKKAQTTPKPAKKEDVKKEDKSEKRMVQCPTEDLKGRNIRLWYKKDLEKFDGSKDKKIYIGFMGIVYDVTSAVQHYGPGSEYNAFAGKDATRAFVTGNFTHDLHDDLSNIEKNLYTHLESWSTFYSGHYPAIGRVEGAFFDSKGCATSELIRIYQVFQELEGQKAQARQLDQDLPECNSEWNAELNKGRVWCSTKSGGVERDWIGVPRIHLDGETKRCVCLNIADQAKSEELSKNLSLYSGCNPTATECPTA